AGVIVGIVALPLSMALAIATGLPPMMGLFTAIFAGGTIALLGGSQHQVSGPTAAFIVVLVPIIGQFGVNGLMVAGLLAGALLILMGLCGFGAMIRFIPYPVTSGFTAGIAVSIATTQVHGFFGLTLPAGTQLARLDYTERVAVLAESMSTMNLHVLAIGALTLAVLILWPRYASRRLPAPLPALVISTLGALALRRWADWHDVPVLGERFSIRGTLAFAWPGTFDPRPFMTPEAIADAHAEYFAPFAWTWTNVRALLPAAFSIAMLGAIESLLSAVVADGLADTRHRSNTELIGQGVGNLVSPFFGGFAATGAIARTATNVRNGGRSPLAALVHALTVLAFVALAAPLAEAIPLSALAAVLLIVCWNMAEVRHFIGLLRAPRSDVLVLLTCLLLTVLVDMVWAVAVGVVLASLLFMRRMAELSEVRPGHEDDDADANGQALADLPVPPGVTVYSIDGPFCFGATDKAVATLGDVEGGVRVVVLRMRRVPAIDATGLHALRKARDLLARRGVRLVLSAVQPQPLRALQRSGLAAELGEENIHADVLTALDRARTLTAGPH
ncbi:MAG: STAS domain-containing protein, partial [Myxococcales bacterium]|nr:STAS domain-containing protein [Myxococcales bacterium]